MRVRFWGTRGSLPTALNGTHIKAKLARALALSVGHDLSSPRAIDEFIESRLDFATRATFGGNSSCVQLDTGNEHYTICDMGSGLRELGIEAMRHQTNRPQVFDIFLSHLHWDHIMGFPFFTPAFVPQNVIRIHGCHTQLESALRAQNAEPGFPVEFSDLPARIEFVQLQPDHDYEIGGLQVRAHLQAHGGDSYGYRFEHRQDRADEKVVVYSTDGEHRLDDAEQLQGMIDLYQDADLVIFDAMYSLADSVSLKEDWGHSS
ncbi:MAG: MBL fold metallo-hydrolase, partial [Gammaproteobacteria bacterium]|nr:MBL fold metallo-hydrolase [Gammaproteobacteria bacterium]